MYNTYTADSHGPEAVRSFLEAVGRYDREYPLSEYKELRQGGGGNAIEVLIVDDDLGPIGYAQAAWHPGAEETEGHYAIELAVAPFRRTTDVVTGLLTEIVSRIDTAGITLWAHSKYIASAAVAGGWVPARTLMRMSCDLPVRCAGAVESSLPIRTFRAGEDDAAWLRANNLAFAGHPENGCLQQVDLDRRIEQPWFDPAGFFVAWDGDEIAGSCWTKVHPGGIGEIYIIGVVPSWAGRGLGRDLVCRGLTHLSDDRNLRRAMLYVEADNTAAMKLYENLGFVTEKTITAFELPDGAERP